MQTITTKNHLRENISAAYRMDETTCVNQLIALANFSEEELAHIANTATELILKSRAYYKSKGKIESLLHQYDLSTDEGIALMCLAEALLRIPDKATIDKFISDKLSTAQFKNHLQPENSLFINAATWSLLLTGKIYTTHPQNNHLLNWLKRAVHQLGIKMVRPVILRMMKIIGKQFVIGENIQEALKKAVALEKKGYQFSYDMLGEAARTEEDANQYYLAYEQAIVAIGQSIEKNATHSLGDETVYGPIHHPGISIKLSALHPRYEYTKHQQLLKELPPLLVKLAQVAQQYGIGVTIDAEEADRLELSLDIFEKIFTDPLFEGWEGLGLALQAYQKRAYSVIDWLAELAKRHKKRIMLRLVKGAYWDAEIKSTQVNGFKDYPVFTRKAATDVSYIACAKKMLSLNDYFYSQFATHNAYSVASILELAKKNAASQFEFQCLHGMGLSLYDQIVDSAQFHIPCRIYAPVGTHRDLLGYLIRRLLENGANSSFINKLADETLPIEKIIADPSLRMASLIIKPHPRIPLPKNIYEAWENSIGIDFSNPQEAQAMEHAVDVALKENWLASSIINGNINEDILGNKNRKPRKTIPSQQSNTIAKNIFSPANKERLIGSVVEATPAMVAKAITCAQSVNNTWAATTIEERAQILEKAADLIQLNMPTYLALLIHEGGRCILDAVAEVREAIDYCRYYAYQACVELQPQYLPGPTGESNVLSLHPRGIIACISPWNFPLAIFIGQIVAALAAGNTVIAKPAEQTPLIAYQAIQLLHEAGIPKAALQLLLGDGAIGETLVSSPHVAGVLFTGSFATAKQIALTLAKRESPIALFVAETGGINAMIVDSSALIEQAIIDITQSAFNSAGQRCSALRILFVQADIAPKLITMLQGYMQTLIVGDPRLLETDVGPVIDDEALQKLNQHFSNMSEVATLIAKAPLATSLNGRYFAPCAFELSHADLLKEEVFGPFLHIVRYKENELEKVIESIGKTQYGLTLGIHSRIDKTVKYILEKIPVGNAYVNRNMIGAVVGVQPFGGEGFSGTGPKAGGPHYLPRLCLERALAVNTTAFGGNARLVSLLEED